MKKFFRKWGSAIAAITFGLAVGTIAGKARAEDSLLGSVVGAAVGGYAGHHIGGGRGKIAATVIGAGVGAHYGGKWVGQWTSPSPTYGAPQFPSSYPQAYVPQYDGLHSPVALPAEAWQAPVAYVSQRAVQNRSYEMQSQMPEDPCAYETTIDGVYNPGAAQAYCRGRMEAQARQQAKYEQEAYQRGLAGK